MIDARAIHDLEFGLFKWRRYFVLNHLNPSFITYDLVPLLDRTNAANVETNRRIKLEGVTTGCGLRASKHHTDLHTNLVDENNKAVGLLNGAGQLAHCLTEQSRLKADV